MYQIEKEYLSLMYACKFPKNENVKHCVAKIVGMNDEYITDSCINFWLSKAIEAFRPYDMSIVNRFGYSDMCDYITKYEDLYKPNFTNEYQRVNKWLEHILRNLIIRTENENGEYVNIYESI